MKYELKVRKNEGSNWIVFRGWNVKTSSGMVKMDSSNTKIKGPDGNWYPIVQK